MTGTFGMTAYAVENTAMARLVTMRILRLPKRSASDPVKGALNADA
jgi:hypothetical protein